MILHVCDMKYEQGNTAEAIAMLEHDLSALLSFHPAEAESAKRLRLALANTYLMKALWKWDTEGLDRDPLRIAKLQFEELEENGNYKRSIAGMHDLLRCPR